MPANEYHFVTEWRVSAEISASGDFVGRGVWRLHPDEMADGLGTHIVFDWQIRADKPLLRWFSPVFKPIFKWNHGWAMAKGFENLRREVERRRSNDCG